MAVQAGKAVRAIVMEDPPAFIDVDHMRAWFVTILPMKALPVDERVEELMKTMKMVRDAAEARAEKLGNMSESVMTVAFYRGSIYKPEDLLSKIDCPTLVIIGNVSKGGVVDWTGRARLQRLLKGSKILEWPDVGHGVHTEAPDRFIATVSDFLRGLS